MNCPLKCLIVPAFLLAAVLHADWPHYRGPNFDGIAAGEKLGHRDFPQVWKSSVMTGFSGITVVDGLLYTMGNDGRNDLVWCLDAATGKPVWKHSYACAIDPNMYEGGPNATPTIHDGRVYTLSKEGHVYCLDARTGKELWSSHARKVGASPPKWGFSGSATVLGDLVIYNLGDHGTAFHRLTGDVAWKSGGGGCGYASPVPFRQGGTEAVAIFTGSGLAGVAVASGKLLWKTDWKTSYDVNAASPLILGNRIFIGSGYNRGCAMVDISAGQPRQLWENKALRTMFNTAVFRDGYLYGPDGNHTNRGLVCLDAATGETRWSEKSIPFPSVVLADGKLYVLDTRGALIVVEATPEGYRELGRQNILQGKCWTVPTIAGGHLYARNAAGDLVCHKLTQ